MIWRIIASLFMILQGPAFPGPGSGPFTAASGVSLDAHNYYANQTLSSCADSVTSNCQITTTFSVPTTGDAVDVAFQGCWNAGCSTGHGGTITVVDGTNSYSVVSAASNDVSGFFLLRYTACNATAGTYTLTINSSTGDAFWYMRAEAATYKGAHATGCLDTVVSHLNTGSATTATGTSAGNPSATGEIGVVFINGTPPFSAPTCTQLDYNSADGIGYENTSNPSTGSTFSCSVTQASGNYTSSTIAFKP